MSLQPGSFEALIHPVTPAEFFERYWEENYLFLSRKEPDRYRSLFSFPDIDRCIHAARDTSRNVLSIVPPPGSGRSQQNLRGIDLSPKRLYSAFHGGDTISIQAAERLWAPLANFSASIADALSAVVGVNIYMTPANSQGFNVHFDTHEVFVVQVEGSKRWFVYERYHDSPVESGNARQYVRKQAQPKPTEEEVLLEEILLEEGDVLYLPRGFPHKAKTSGEPSIHLTLGVHTMYWMDMLKAAVEVVAEQDHRFRRSLPPGFTHDPEVTATMSKTFGELVAALHESIDATGERVIDEVVQYHLNMASYPPDGHFSQLTKLEALDLESVVERRPGLDCRVINSGSNAGILFPDNEILGPASIGAALRYIRSTRRFKVAELPGLDDKSKVVLTRRLVREGLLRVPHESAAG